MSAIAFVPRRLTVASLAAILLALPCGALAQAPSPPPTISGSVSGDGSKPPVGWLPNADHPWYDDQPTAFDIAPGHIPTQLRFGVGLLAETTPTDFSGTTEDSDEPVLFTAIATVPSKVLLNGNPNGYYVLRPYFMSDEKISCHSPACAGQFVTKVYAKWGSVAGLVKLEDGTGIPGLGVYATPMPNPLPEDPRWNFHYVAVTNAHGLYSFAGTELSPYLPESPQCVPPLQNECVKVPIARQNNWGLPVLGDGGVIHRDKSKYSNTPGVYNWEIRVSNARSAPAIVESSKETQVSFTLSLEEYLGALAYDRDHRPEWNDDPDGKGGRNQCGSEGGGPQTAPFPVSLITGNVFLDQEDAILDGLRHDVPFTRSYNSFDTRPNDLMGRGWTHSFEKSIEEVLPGLLRLRTPQGVPAYFSDKGNQGVFTPYGNPHGRSSISRLPNGAGYARVFRSGGAEQYDGQGRLETRTDRTGRSVTVSYDPSGRPSEVHTPEGQTLRMVYEGPQGRLSRIEGPDGILAEYQYRISGIVTELASVRYPDSTGYLFTYDGAHRLTNVTDMGGVTLHQHAYNSNGKASSTSRGGEIERRTYAYGIGETTVIDALGNVSTFTYTSKLSGRFVTRVTGCGFCGSSSGTQEWEVDDEGHTTKYTDAQGNVTVYEWEDGNLVAVTDAMQARTAYSSFDAFGRPQTISHPTNGTTTVQYTVEGVKSITPPIGRRWDFDYVNQRLTSVRAAGQIEATVVIDDRGKVASVADARGLATQFTYDSSGRILTATAPGGRVTEYVRGAGGRLEKIIAPNGSETRFQYDRSGRVDRVTDDTGRTWSRSFDSVGRLIATTDPIQATTRFSYDVMSHLIQLTDANGHATQFGYDSHGRLDRVTNATGGSEFREYFPTGLLHTLTDRRGITSTFAYDANSRLTSVAYSDATPSVQISYNDAQRRVTLQNGDSTLSEVFDQVGRIVSETSTVNGVPGAAVVASTYGADDLRATLSLNSSQVASYLYQDGALKTIRLPSPDTFLRELQFDYNADGERSSLHYPNGIETTYDYSTVEGWLTRVHSFSDTATVADAVYTHDRRGNRLTKAIDGLEESYGYDAIDRLVSVGTPSPQHRSTFSFDLAGNRVRDVQSGVGRSLTYDATNELVSVGEIGRRFVAGSTNEGATVTVNGQPARALPGNSFEVDLEPAPPGNQAQIAATDSSGNTRTSTYALTAPQAASSYTYDPNGNLLTRTDGTDTWAYQWNARNELKRVLRNGATVAEFVYDPIGRRIQKTASGHTTVFVYDGSDILAQTVDGQQTTTFIHGPGIDEPLARLLPNGQFEYFHADGLGSIVATTISGGGVAVKRSYDAWGNLESGASEPGLSFTGREWDPEIGLYYYRARYYDPKAGRFISEDPIGFSGGVNFYGYVGGRPTNLSDAYGLAPTFSSPSERVTGQYNRATGRIDITINVPDPYASEIEAVYVHENEHMRIHKDGLNFPQWKDEQEAFRKELEYLGKRIEQLKSVESSDCRSGTRQRATEELSILRTRWAEADGITAYESEAKRYVEKQNPLYKFRWWDR